MIELLRLFQTIFSFAIIGRIVMLYVSPQGNDPISPLLYQATEPILGPIRRLLPSMGGFDLSPMIALIVLNVIINRLIVIL
ncbi:MAG: YggT family protein [SAR202 cluster bacterium]|nr:YggT family protein [SAR202 cluster bacterium]